MIKKHTLISLLISAFVLISAPWNAVAESTASKNSESLVTPDKERAFKAWLEQFKPKAISSGISQQTVDYAFSHIRLNAKVLELDRRQPEFTQTFWGYFNRAVTPWRIEQGQKFYRQHRPLLDAVTKKYGVSGRFLVAFWGLETNFGHYTGNINIIESLATLSFDERRSAFFQKQLIAALKILDKKVVPFEEMKGSWAGAMGQCQFMPTNYLRYAVDGDGDGKVDLWHSLSDVFYSMGNFLKALGWHKGETWGREVRLPKGFDLALADGKTKRPLNEWRQMGIHLADGRPLPNVDINAALLLPSDYRGPFFLVYPNFFVIKRWNNSNNYALAVGHLADRIVGLPPLSVSQPADDQPLSKTQTKQIQQQLKDQGYKISKVDGIAGSQTRQAIRQYQKQNRLPADGQPTAHLLKQLKGEEK